MEWNLWDEGRVVLPSKVAGFCICIDVELCNETMVVVCLRVILMSFHVLEVDGVEEWDVADNFFNEVPVGGECGGGIIFAVFASGV